MSRSTKVLVVLSLLCLLGSVTGVLLHVLSVQSFKENIRKKTSKHSVAQITLYLQIPQHVLEIICALLLTYGLLKAKRQLILPWLIVNAIGIVLYSILLLVMGMILSGYFFSGYIFIGFYAYLWYQIQYYFSNLESNGAYNIPYNVVE